MKITLEDYYHRCHDGCCDTYGYNVFVGGKLVGTIEGDSVHELVELLNRTTEGNAFPSVTLNNTQP